MPRSSWLAALLTLAVAPAALAGPRITAHDIEVSLTPATGRLEARDVLTVVRDGGGPLEFRLNAGLEVLEAFLDERAATGLERVGDDGWTATWHVDVTPGPGAHGRLIVHYAGTVTGATRGDVGPEGVHLAADSAWYPADGGLAAYTVRAHAPAPYTIVTQGTHVGVEGAWSTWRSKIPADGLALIAGRWQRYERTAGSVTLGVYLSRPDAGRAARLLDAAAAQIALQRARLGPYPFDRLDVVESRVERRLEAPGFALLPAPELAPDSSVTLGRAVARAWWGHSVLVDEEDGDWSPGLASYCADYLPLEMQDEAAARALRERTNVRCSITGAGRDRPLRELRAGSTDVVGVVGRSRMVFHMLRGEIGDAAFRETLRRVARERAGTRVGWRDWETEFERSSRRNLGAFFRQWLDRTGGPRLGLANVRLETHGGRMRVSGELTQALGPGEEPWRVSVPLAVDLLDGRELVLVDLAAASAPFSLLVPSIPLRVTADPGHQVLRRLAPDEVPPCLAATLRRGPLLIYPDGDTVLRAAAEMGVHGDALAVPASEAPAAPPRGRSLFVLGDAERVPLLAALRSDLPGHFPAPGTGVAILATARNPADEDHFISTFSGSPAAVAALAREAYEYAFDGRVVFVDGVVRERSAVRARRRTERFVLPDLRSSEDGDRVEKILAALVAPGMDGRLGGSRGEAEARRFVATTLRVAGLDVRELPFSFEVRRSGELPALRRGAETVVGCHPLVASPLTPPAGVTLHGVVENDARHVEGRGVLLDVPSGSDDPLAFVRSAAALAGARGAAALLVRVPAAPPRRIAELWETPEALHEEVAADLAARARRGEASDPLMRAARTAARIGSDDRLPLPVVAVPHDLVPSTSEHVVQIAFDVHRVESANVVARVRPAGRPAARPTERSGGRRTGAIVVGAHLDHLGPGFPGAHDNASGVAAVLEAAHVLSVNQDLLGREVLFVLFGAHEWGLRGSRAFCANLRPETLPAACIDVHGVGRRGLADIEVIGMERHPRLGRLVAAALGRAGLPAGDGSELFSYAHGSDHWPFHELDVEAVSLSSGGSRTHGSPTDTLATVSPTKVRRVARALSLAALAASIGL